MTTEAIPSRDLTIHLLGHHVQLSPTDDHGPAVLRKWATERVVIQETSAVWTVHLLVPRDTQMLLYDCPGGEGKTLEEAIRRCEEAAKRWQTLASDPTVVYI